MNRNTILAFILSVITLVVLISLYEHNVYIWSLTETTPIIRLDIAIAYPIILAITTTIFSVVYFILKHFNKK